MEAYFEWLQGLPTSVWIAESESIWAYPLVLFLHSIGMGLSVGSAFAVCLRLLGAAGALPVSSFRVMFRIFWGGFYLNLVTGSLLFAAAATTTGHIPVYYAKLMLIMVGTVLSVSIRRFVDGAASDGVSPGVRALAAASVVIWLGVIATGRLVAYLH